MEKKNVRIVVEIKNAEQVPGWGYDPQDYVDLIQRHLDQVIPHYEPRVRLEEPTSLLDT